jgi:hypothetical protein
LGSDNPEIREDILASFQKQIGSNKKQPNVAELLTNSFSGAKLGAKIGAEEAISLINKNSSLTFKDG